MVNPTTHPLVGRWRADTVNDIVRARLDSPIDARIAFWDRSRKTCRELSQQEYLRQAVAVATQLDRSGVRARQPVAEPGKGRRDNRG